MKQNKDIFGGMVEEDELVNLADNNQNGGWEIVGSVTAIIAVLTYVACPSAPCTSTGYCK